MSDARPVGDGDRLPWLEPYRETPRRSAPAPRPAKGGRRSPLIIGLIAAAALAFGGYWIGRKAAPGEPGASVTAPLPPAADRLAYRSLDERLTEPPPPPPPPPPPEAEQPAPRPANAATRPHRRVIRALPRNSELASVRRHQEAAAPPPRPPHRVTVRTSTIPVGKRGEVVLLGTFASPALADAARSRLVARYPYLGTLPKAIAPVPWGRRTAFQLKMGPGSRRNARTLCKYMLSIGRGCAVV